MAFRLLAVHGPAGVTIGNLCAGLGVTKGSFYYYFTDMTEFAETFAEYWEASMTALLAVATTAAAPLDRMGEMVTALASLAHEAEAALRAWAHSTHALNLARLRVDEQIEEALAAIAYELLSDPAAAGLLARQVVGLAIGLQHRRRPIDRLEYLQAVAGLVESACQVEGLIDEDDGTARARFVPRTTGKQAHD